MKKTFGILIIFLIMICLVGCKPKIYTITLIHNDNITKLEFQEETSFYYDEIFEEGYIFYGWFDDNGNDAIGKVIRSNETFYGKYIKEGTKYKINYILNGGELRVYAPLEYEIGKITELVKPLPVGLMKFLGWYINDELITEINEQMYGDITIEAKWEDNNIYHTVNYELNGGKIESEYLTTFIEGLSYYYFSTPKKEGYLFKGWYTDSSYTNRIINITPKTNTDLTLYAKFEEYKEENLTISFLGDSITTYLDAIPSSYPTYYPTQGCDVNNIEKTWWYQVLQETNYKLIMNNSFSGSKVSSGDGCAKTIERINNLSKNNETPDIVVIYMGTNDLTHRIVSSTFEKSYKEMIDLIRQQCDDAIIYVLNLPSMKHQGFVAERLVYNDIISKIAKEKDLILVDIASIITEENYSNYLFAGAHPNALGMKIISEEVIKTINKNK